MARRSQPHLNLPVVIGSVALLLLLGFVLFPFIDSKSGFEMKFRERDELKVVQSIVLVLRCHALDYEGRFPGSNGKIAFRTSNDAFNSLIPDYIDTELVFWKQNNHPDFRKRPLDDMKLEKGECVYAYVAGQTDASFSRSPLVLDGMMDKNGLYNRHHPHHREKKAVVGFIGGHVLWVPLTSNRLDRDLLTPRSPGGRGLLDTDPINILLPE